MKVNEKWLREWVDPGVAVDEIAGQLTMAGLEVDALTAQSAAFSGVVVGEVLSVAAHPDADQLRVCQVSDGAAAHQVVCGAPNVAAGIKVPFAQVGAVLPGGAIEPVKLRGVESQGMLCGSSELDLGVDDGGLMCLPSTAPVGAQLDALLGLDDQIIELDITPNRGDCFSLLGVAREVAVMNALPLDVPAIEPVASTIADSAAVTIEAPEHCPRYCARIVRGVDPGLATPLWMQEKLRRVGLRSIDPIVDVTNYVMMELGQPMHAFDLAALSGGVVVRLARPDEQLTLLDGQVLTLSPDTLVIADQERALAVAGIMGGRGSGVGAETCDILLESAFFAPQPLAGKARVYGLHTDSSHRFERGVDYTGQRRALERATALLLSIVGGEPGPVVESVCEPQLPTRTPIPLRRARIRQLLGLELEDAQVLDLLARLGISVASSDGQGWVLTPPPWRFDLAIEADLLEELARVYGYNRLPVDKVSVPLDIGADREARVDKRTVRRFLLARGYQEAITYSFVAPEHQQYFADPESAIDLANPISAEMRRMRQSLWPGLLTALSYNLNRQLSRVRLFETGLVFERLDGEMRQTAMLGGAITGSRWPESWASDNTAVDFFDLKGDLEAVLSATGRMAEFSYEAAVRPGLHDGQCAKICRAGQAVGWIACLHPEVQRALDLAQPVYLFEVEMDAVCEGGLPEFEPLSKFPEVRRDISLIVDRSVPVEQMLSCIRALVGERLAGLTVFDAYQGKGIENQRISLGLGLTFRDRSRTLNDGEINALIKLVVDTLASRYGAALRD